MKEKGNKNTSIPYSARLLEGIGRTIMYFNHIEGILRESVSVMICATDPGLASIVLTKGQRRWGNLYTLFVRLVDYKIIDHFAVSAEDKTTLTELKELLRKANEFRLELVHARWMFDDDEESLCAFKGGDTELYLHDGGITEGTKDVVEDLDMTQVSKHMRDTLRGISNFRDKYLALLREEAKRSLGIK